MEPGDVIGEQVEVVETRTDDKLSEIAMMFQVSYDLAKSTAQMTIVDHTPAAAASEVQYQLGKTQGVDGTLWLSSPMSMAEAQTVNVQGNLLQGDAFMVVMTNRTGKQLVATLIDRTFWPNAASEDKVSTQYTLAVPVDRLSKSL